MRTLPFFQIDAFTSERFKGNPAAVVFATDPLDAGLCQRIAQENNLAETAFVTPAAAPGCDYRIRWFTPTVEVDLCGHATLASAHACRKHLGWTRDRVVFESNSGPLPVSFAGDSITLDFPASPPKPIEMPAGLAEALGDVPDAVLNAWCWLAVFDSPERVRALKPDMAAIANLETFAVIATAAGPTGAGEPDFVSRFFAPGAGVPEDPVTGSAHCVSGPYWAECLGKPQLTAEQWSDRRGRISLRVDGDRIHLTGHAVTVIEGTLRLD